MKFKSEHEIPDQKLKVRKIIEKTTEYFATANSVRKCEVELRCKKINKIKTK